MNIELLGDRFIGMFREETENGFVFRLEVDFRSKINGLKWTVFNKKNADDIDLIYTIPKSENEKEIYHVLGMNNVTFDELIRHSKNIIDFNMEVEEKKLLLKEKIEELGELFTKHTIDELRKLQFVFSSEEPIVSKPVSEPTVKTRKPKKQTPKKTEPELFLQCY